jgi:hypothetical protein
MRHQQVGIYPQIPPSRHAIHVLSSCFSRICCCMGCYMHSNRHLPIFAAQDQCIRARVRI